MSDQTETLQQSVQKAIADKTPLRIVGNDTKAFYGNDCLGEPLSLAQHRGVIAYEPSELFITVRAGTTLREIESVLAEQNQMLPFEPPAYDQHATIGGVLACGFSGPRRPFAGAARDGILGCKLINGNAEVLNFGGQVMKNVAGYDVSRLMVGALGTLGVLLEVTLKVLPQAETELSIAHTLSTQEALDVMNARAGKPLPLSAAAYDGEAMVLRLSGTETAVKAARQKMAGDVLEHGPEWWRSIKEQQHYFFQAEQSLWRLSLAPGTLPLGLQGQWFFDWGGAVRWLFSDMPAGDIRDAVAAEGGHAVLFRGRDYYRHGPVDVFHPLPKPLFAIHQRLKQAFDPHAIFNRGRFLRELELS